MIIKGIAFDLEGTIIDIEAVHHNGHLAAAGDFGLLISPDEAFDKIPHFIGGPDEKVCEDIWKLLAPEIQKQTKIKDVLDRDKFHYERLLGAMPIELRRGFAGFLNSVRSLNLEISIGSVNPKSQATVIFERLGLLNIFPEEKIILREHVENLKPAPDVFLKTAEAMKIRPENQLVFEDSPNGVRAALAAGSKAVGMPVIIRGSTVAALVEAGAVRIFFDWSEIDAPALVKNLSR